MNDPHHHISLPPDFFADSSAAPDPRSPAAPAPPPRRVAPADLAEAKRRGEKWCIVTAYDYLTAGILEEAGIPVLLVGDSAAGAVYGHARDELVTTDELLPLVRAVVRATSRALVVADLPFGTYEATPEQALATAVRFVKEAGAHAVKIEGGARVTTQIELLTSLGVDVLGHLNGADIADRSERDLVRAAGRLEAAGVCGIVLHSVPDACARAITVEVAVPVIGIASGGGCDAQVLRWQTMAGLTDGPGRRYADLRTAVRAAARAFREDVHDGSYA
jgi:3-methyl-2-oxobutanoate hydroxymethyltransferase